MAVLETDFTCLKPSRSPLCREVKVVLVELTRQHKRRESSYTHPVFGYVPPLCEQFENTSLYPMGKWFLRIL